MKRMKIDIERLQTVNNYAVERGVTPQYIHKLVKNGNMKFFMIDGVKFVDMIEYSSIPVANRRKA